MGVRLPLVPSSDAKAVSLLNSEPAFFLRQAAALKA